MFKRKLNKNMSFRKIRNKNLPNYNDCKLNNCVSDSIRSDKVKEDNYKIEFGTRNSDVERIQKKLLDLTNIYTNLPVVTADGMFNDNTKRTIKKFQQLNAMEITGELDRVTINKINEIHECNKEDIEIRETRQNYINQSKNQLEMGDTGHYVTELQKYLNILNKKYTTIGNLRVDGIYGDKTENAVKEFQNIFNLEIDGKVDDLTWNTLYNATLQNI